MMNNYTLGELVAEPFMGTEQDPTWVVRVKDGDALFSTLSGNDKANANELVHRWEHFEKLLLLCVGNKAQLQEFRRIFVGNTPEKKAMCRVLDEIDKLNNEVILAAKTRVSK